MKITFFRMTVEPSYGCEGDGFWMTVEPSYGRERVNRNSLILHKSQMSRWKYARHPLPKGLILLYPWWLEPGRLLLEWWFLKKKASQQQIHVLVVTTPSVSFLFPGAMITSHVVSSFPIFLSLILNFILLCFSCFLYVLCYHSCSTSWVS